jgi:S-disulfanyl-L-cysteine oxidoreductase SoxD
MNSNGNVGNLQSIADRRRLSGARTHGWALALGICAVATLVAAGQGQGSQQAQPAPRTTGAGVYTADQAAKGREGYANNCAACHTTTQHTGTAFMGTWSGRSLWDLYELIAETMPQTDPGSLPPQEYAQIVAYVLQLNKMPTGRTPLPHTAAELRVIRIGPATPPADRSTP